jgi:Galactose oxidase, central domain
MNKNMCLVVLSFGLCLFSGCGGTSSDGHSSGVDTIGAGNSPPPPPATAAFTVTARMHTARSFHTATRLTNGKVLIAGGKDGKGNPLRASELFDPSTQTFAARGTLATPRFQHTATLLNNGKVLVSGGQDANGNALAAAELFDPSTNLFTSTENMDNARNGNTATLLNDGRVLLAGGGTSTAELFDPGTDQFTPVGRMAASRTFHTATLLADGKVLLAGGMDTNGTALGDLFDPASATFMPTATGGTQALHLAATLLTDGRVFLGGGEFTTIVSGGSTRCCLFGPVSVALAIFFDNSSQSFFACCDMSASRTFHTMTLLGNGKVLIAGGASIVSVAQRGSVITHITSLASAELFDPTSASLAMTSNMTTPRYGHTATLLGNGQVLVTGGVDANGNVLTTAELYR